jgi:hypothetical protein
MSDVMACGNQMGMFKRPQCALPSGHQGNHENQDWCWRGEGRTLECWANPQAVASEKDESVWVITSGGGSCPNRLYGNRFFKSSYDADDFIYRLIMLKPDSLRLRPLQLVAQG